MPELEKNCYTLLQAACKRVGNDRASKRPSHYYRSGANRRQKHARQQKTVPQTRGKTRLVELLKLIHSVLNETKLGLKIRCCPKTRGITPLPTCLLSAKLPAAVLVLFQRSCTHVLDYILVESCLPVPVYDSDGLAVSSPVAYLGRPQPHIPFGPKPNAQAAQARHA
jgi:hypothetical protein